jgi:IS5 family transposase
VASPGGTQRPPAAGPRRQPGLRQAHQAGSATWRPPSPAPASWPARLGPGWPGLHDPDARPIVKGRLGKPVEFGYKAQATDNPDGVVLDYLVEAGNPADAPLLVPAIERIIQQTGRAPGTATTDRGYGEAAVDEELRALGVAQVAILRKGTLSSARHAHEHTRSFRRLVKWRTGCEGRISHLKHRYGWDRTLMDGIDGARIWCGQGVLAHNLVKISGLTAKQQRLATCG